ncbi:MAG: serine hydrolase domain-containing protein [Halioglobus sp.]
MQSPEHSLVAAAEIGLDAAKLDELVQRAQRGIDEGPLPSVQFAVARQGQLALFTTLGAADNNQRYNIFSCTKTLIASAIWKLMAEPGLDISLPVVNYIPQFIGEGKERITVEQLLRHTAGIPHAPLGPAVWSDRQSRLAKMQSWRLNWEPGSQMAYHATSAHWVLAEIITSVTGTDYRHWIEQEILTPLELPRFQLGVPVEQQADITELAFVGEPPTSEELEKIFGVAIDWTGVNDEALLLYNLADTRALGVPGAGGVSDAASVALYYQGLIHNQNQLWDPQVLTQATTVTDKFTDPVTGILANRGLGIVIAGDDGFCGRRGMAGDVSPRCFGHQGLGGQIAWGDPETGISFCAITNGLDANPIRAARFGGALSVRAAAALLPTA